MQKPAPNQIIDGRYRLIRVIGCGAFGTVWCAEHLTLSSLIALKVLDAISMTDELRQRFLREARAAATLRSPHVVQILDCGVDGETPYIVMELLEGESLERRLARIGRLDVVQAERLIRHVARAVERAHEAGIIHRDLKPANVFIQANDGEEIAKVLDFGIAKTAADSADRSVDGLTPAGVLLGTPRYMSPEQVLGEQQLDGRTDIWSLGVIAFECLIGHPPFDGENITDVLLAIFSESRPIPSKCGPVPEGFDAWFARACAPDPANRYATAKRAAEAFAELCGFGRAIVDGSPDAPAPVQIVHVGGSGVAAAGAGEATSFSAWFARRREGLQRAARHPGRELSRGLVRASLLGLAAISCLWISIVMEWRSYDRPAFDSESGPREVRATRPRVGQVPYAAPPLQKSVRVSNESVLESTDSVGIIGSPTSAVDDDSSSALGSPNRARPVAPSSRTEASLNGAQRPMRSPKPKTRPTPLASECNPPWYFDDAGQPRAKPECL